MTKQKTIKYYCVDRWSYDQQTFQRFSRHEDVESANKSAQWWSDLTGNASRVVEIKEKTIGSFYRQKDRREETI